MEKSDYDVIHCHFIVPSGAIAAALSRRFRVPYVLTAHGSDVPGYNPDRFGVLHRIIHPLWRRIVDGACAVTTPSGFLRQLLQSCIDVPVTLIPNSFDVPPPGSVPRGNRILAVSRLFERKGMQFLIDAFRRLNCDWELVIAGDGPYLKSLRSLSEELGAKVKFTGFVTGESLRDLYASAKIFVLPSVQENFPVVLLEAMGAGNAVITTRGSGCEEVIGSAGLLVERANPGELADAMQRLIRDEQQRIHYGRSARERVLEFGEKTIARRFESLLEDCRHAAGPHTRPRS